MNTMQADAAQRYIQADVQPSDPRGVNWKAKPLPFKLYRNCEQIPLSYAGTGSAQETIPTIPVRNGVEGRDSALRLSDIGQMLVDIYGLTRQCHSIAAFHPMLKYLPREETQVMPFYTSLLRPVPSGGALFPCELYLLVGPDQHVPAGIYHYDVAHHALDILKQGDYTSLLQNALAHSGDTPPAYTLLLSSFFWKDGFKYGAFSYRLQGLDIGTVIAQGEIIARHVGLSTTIHYQFLDKALNDLLGLDPLYESVYAVIGISHSSLLPPEAAGEKNEGSVVPILQTPAGEILHPLGKGEPLPLCEGTSTESIACWPLPEEVHRASLIETREAFRPLHSLAPIQPPSGEGETLPLSADTPLDLWEARSKRRSTAGSFLPTPLTKQQLSQLLLTSMRGTVNDLDGQVDFLQHTMLYCVVNRVKAVPPGIYRYKPERHELELVRAEILPHELYQVLSMPNFELFHMSISLFSVGNYKSGFQVYGDRWYRMQHMEAGIIAQRLYLAAAALKLGCRASLGFVVPLTNKFLGLSDAEDDQYTSLMQIMVAPERSTHQYYEQSLLI